MILRGSRLQTGNGKSVKIWQNHWLTRKHPPLVSSPIIPSMEEATVDTLIETKTWQWNYAMIDGIFAPQEAKIIKTIPLALFKSDDILFWPFSKDGNIPASLVIIFKRKRQIWSKVMILRFKSNNYERGFGHYMYLTR